MFPPFLIIFYRAFTHFLNLFTWIIFVIRSMRKKEEWIRKKERFGIVDIFDKADNYIWFHAASVGELLSIKPLVQKLLNENYDILITTTTVSSANLFKKVYPDCVKHQYIPYDTPKYTKRFLNRLNIELAIFVESEIWPNFIMECKKRNIPLLLINARFSDKSFQYWGYAKKSLNYLLGSFKFILPQNTKTHNWFKKLGYENIEFLGNIKHDAEKLEINNDKLEALKKSISNKKIILAASTHHGEEEIIFSLFNKLMLEEDNLILIIAPRHPERAEFISDLAIKKCFKSKQIKFLSKNDEISYETKFIIYDKIGELGELYALADFVILGGAFKSHGGHNPFEPAKFSIPIFTGPNFYNFEDDYKNLFEVEGAIKFTEDSFIKLYKDKNRLITMGKNAERCVKKFGGATEDIFNIIEGIKTNGY